MQIFGRLPITLAITVIFTIIIAIVSVKSLQNYSQDEQLVNHTFQVKYALEKVFSSVISDETSVRGYIITGNQQSLTNYTNNQKATKENLQNAQNLTKDNPAQQKNLSELEPLIAQRINILDQSVLIRDSQGFDAAQAFIQQGAGADTMRAVRAKLDNMNMLEDQLYNTRVADAAKSLQQTYSTLGIAYLLDLLLICASYYFFLRELQSREVLEQRKNDFISMASHELRTPLTSMNAFVYALKKQVKNSQAQRWIYKLESQVKSQTKLINELLDQSRMQEGKLTFSMEPYDINKIIADVVETTQPNVKHKIIVKGKAKKLVHCDKERITQVINNLLSNAIKYSPNAKKVIITIENLVNKAKIYVQDFGIGIPKDNKAFVFNRFYRVEHDKTKKFPGLGLGLFITAEIIKRHNGTISIKSKEGKGSTFSFTLPFINNQKTRTK